MENPIKMDDLGKPTILGNIHMFNGFAYVPWEDTRSTSPNPHKDSSPTGCFWYLCLRGDLG